jgi:hypothetical protein
MCPFCLSTIGLVVAGAVSTGGLTALAVKLSRTKKNGNEKHSQLQGKEKFQ